MKHTLLRLTAALVFFYSGINAATYYAIASGDWSLATTWATDACGGSAIAVSAPGASDDVVICSGIAVNLDAGFTCQSLTIQGSGALLSTSASTLTITGLLTLDNTANVNLSTSTTAILTAGSLLVPATATGVTVGNFNFTISGTTDVNGMISFTTIGGNKAFIGMVTVNAGGDWSSAGTPVNFRNGITSNGNSFFAGSASFTVNAQSITGSTALNFANTVSVASVFLTNNATVNMNATTPGALTGSGASLAKWIQGPGSILNYKSGSMSGSCPVDFSTSPNTVHYFSSGNQTIRSTTYYHLKCSGSGGKALNSNLTVMGNIDVQGSVTLFCADHQITGNATGTFTMASGTIMTLGDPTVIANILFPTNFTAPNIFLDPNSTVSYQSNCTLTQDISAVPVYGHLIMTCGGSPGPKPVVNGTVLDIAGNLTISQGTLDMTTLSTMNVGGTASIVGTLLYNIASAKTVTIMGDLSGIGTVDMANSLQDTLILSGANNSIGTFSISPQMGTVIYNRAGNQQVFASAYPTLVCAGSGNKMLQGNSTVNDTLHLNSGNLYLDTFNLMLANNSLLAVDRMSGNIISEQANNKSSVSWNIGTTAGTYVFPFGTNSGDYIPFTFELVSGAAGNVTLSTYPTNAANMPLPVMPDLVTNINDGIGNDNSANTVNRFWQIDKSGVACTANFTFTYADNEWDGASEPSNYEAQRYDTVLDVWEVPLSGQTQNTATNSVSVSNVSAFSPWTLEVYTPVGIKTTEAGSAFTLYPNPANGMDVQLALAGNKGETIYAEISDVNGKVVSSTQFTAKNEQLNSYSLQGSKGLAAGVYVVKVQTQEGVFTRRLIVN